MSRVEQEKVDSTRGGKHVANASVAARLRCVPQRRHTACRFAERHSGAWLPMKQSVVHTQRRSVPAVWPARASAQLESASRALRTTTRSSLLQVLRQRIAHAATCNHIITARGSSAQVPLRSSRVARCSSQLGLPSHVKVAYGSLPEQPRRAMVAERNLQAHARHPRSELL